MTGSAWAHQKSRWEAQFIGRCGVYTSGGIDLVTLIPSVPDHLRFGRIRFKLDPNFRGYCWSPNFVLVDRDWLADRLSPPIRCTSGTDLVLLIAYMCPSSLEIHISSSIFLHFWQGDSRKSQDLAWAASSVPRKSDQAATNSEFCSMQGPGTQRGLSIGFDASLLSF